MFDSSAKAPFSVGLAVAHALLANLIPFALVLPLSIAGSLFGAVGANIFYIGGSVVASFTLGRTSMFGLMSNRVEAWLAWLPLVAVLAITSVTMGRMPFGELFRSLTAISGADPTLVLITMPLVSSVAYSVGWYVAPHRREDGLG